MSDSENSQNEQETVERCEICNVYEGTKAQVRGHRPRCMEKREREVDALNTLEEIDLEEEVDRAHAEAQAAEKEPETEPETSEPVVARERETPDRKERVPLGVRRLKLAVPERPGFHRRWMNDGWKHDPSRISDAEAGGYVLVEGVAPRVVGSNDNSTAITARLMEIPQELYDEDQAAKAREIDEKEKTINKGSGIPGDNQYVPDVAANRR